MNYELSITRDRDLNFRRLLFNVCGFSWLTTKINVRLITIAQRWLDRRIMTIIIDNLLVYVFTLRHTQRQSFKSGKQNVVTIEKKKRKSYLRLHSHVTQSTANDLKPVRHVTNISQWQRWSSCSRIRSAPRTSGRGWIITSSGPS
jgi:hypothetical protein